MDEPGCSINRAAVRDRADFTGIERLDEDRAIGPAVDRPRIIDRAAAAQDHPQAVALDRPAEQVVDRSDAREAACVLDVVGEHRDAIGACAHASSDVAAVGYRATADQPNTVIRITDDRAAIVDDGTDRKARVCVIRIEDISRRYPEPCSGDGTTVRDIGRAALDDDASIGIIKTALNPIAADYSAIVEMEFRAKGKDALPVALDRAARGI